MRVAPLVVYGSGLAQGLALVTFPAASSILTSPSGYDLSHTQYGLMFVPQVVLAIASASLSPVWARRWTLRRVLLAGLVANLTSMLLLLASDAVSSTSSAYVLLLMATGALGFGFGASVPALTTFAARLEPERADRSVLTLNALLGTGTALAPVLVAIFDGLGAWWLLPLLVAAGLACLVVSVALVALDAGIAAPRTGTGLLSGLPRRFGWYAAAVLLYGICETMFGNWSTLYLTDERGLSSLTGSLSLATFWAMVTVGRIGIAGLAGRFPISSVYVGLPALIAVGSLAVAAVRGDVAAVMAFGLAGLACSGFLPLSLSFAGREFPRIAATSSGELIAGYQVGYGVTAFGVPLLESATGATLGALYVVVAGFGVLLVAVAHVVTRSARLIRSR